MHREYFRTDGIRGRVGVHPITPQFFMQLGLAAGKVLANFASTGDKRPAVLLGKDTRISGYMLESAIQAGLIAAGVDVYLAGPLPTSAIAYLTRAFRLQAGIVITASHNPYPDNGIKFFSDRGFKLPDVSEQAIEALLEQPMEANPSERLGKAERIEHAAGRYVEFCKSTFPHEHNLRGIKIVVDSAHGAAFVVASHVFHELGADVVAIGRQPDGRNINDGYGSTAPDNLRKAVVAERADVGIALDGDGDRLAMVDSAGSLYYGDQLLYVIARHRQTQGKLQGGVAGTHTTNLGFEQAMQSLGIPFERAGVGDHHVLASLRQHGWLLGGDSSGHIICLDKHTTGDGIVSALQVLCALLDSGRDLAAAIGDLHLYPQATINVQRSRDLDCLKHDRVKAVVSDAEKMLCGKGRVLLRPSGTEPLWRVMVEGEDAQVVEHAARRIADVIASLNTV